MKKIIVFIIIFKCLINNIHLTKNNYNKIIKTKDFNRKLIKIIRFKNEANCNTINNSDNFNNYIKRKNTDISINIFINKIYAVFKNIIQIENINFIIENTSFVFSYIALFLLSYLSYIKKNISFLVFKYFIIVFITELSNIKYFLDTDNVFHLDYSLLYKYNYIRFFINSLVSLITIVLSCNVKFYFNNIIIDMLTSITWIILSGYCLYLTLSPKDNILILNELPNYKRTNLIDLNSQKNNKSHKYNNILKLLASKNESIIKLIKKNIYTYINYNTIVVLILISLSNQDNMLDIFNIALGTIIAIITSNILNNFLTNLFDENIRKFFKCINFMISIMCLMLSAEILILKNNNID